LGKNPPHQKGVHLIADEYTPFNTAKRIKIFLNFISFYIFGTQNIPLEAKIVRLTFAVFRPFGLGRRQDHWFSLFQTLRQLLFGEFQSFIQTSHFLLLGCGILAS
jgi:hypothetical protein